MKSDSDFNETIYKPIFEDENIYLISKKIYLDLNEYFEIKEIPSVIFLLKELKFN